MAMAWFLRHTAQQAVLIESILQVLPRRSFVGPQLSVHAYPVLAPSLR